MKSRVTIYNFRSKMRIISLTTANRNFSKIIKEVEQGEVFVVTRRGRPVAKLTPHKLDKTVDPEWFAAYESLMTLLEEGAHLGGFKINRDELYDRN